MSLLHAERKSDGKVLMLSMNCVDGKCERVDVLEVGISVGDAGSQWHTRHMGIVARRDGSS